MRKPFVATLLILAVSVPIAFGQTASTLDSSDFALLRNAQFTNQQYAPHHVSYGFGSACRSLNPFYHLLAASMYAYQSTISPFIAHHCAYSPSCLTYSKELIEEYGLLKGVLLTADRLTRCNRVALTNRDSQYLRNEGHGYIHEAVDRYHL